MINVENLTFTYRGVTTPAVKHLSFQVQPGEIFGFLGPSGAGKSTTQKILIGLLRGFQGQVTVLGKPLSQWASDYYERIGVSFELPNHFLKLTAIENLSYFASLYRGATQTPQQLLAAVGLENDGEVLVSQYSKGMKNRLTLARALIHNPELLFLDEPTSGLDPLNARRVKELILAQQQAGKTVFMTTHNMAVAEELCQRVAFMVDGEIKLIDAPRALKLKYGSAKVRVEYLLNQQTAQQEFPLEGLGQNETFLDLLRRYPLQTIHTQEATLEEIFIQTTGRRLA